MKNLKIILGMGLMFQTTLVCGSELDMGPLSNEESTSSIEEKVSSTDLAGKHIDPLLRKQEHMPGDETHHELVYDVLHDKYNILHFAACSGHLNLVKSLVQEGTKIDSLSEKGFNVLEVAIINEEVHLIPYLIKKQEKNINVIGEKGYNILHLAALKGKLTSVRYLVEEERMGLTVGTRNGLNVLEVAIAAGKLNVVRYLLEEQKIDTDLFNKRACNLLNLAIKLWRLDIVEYLIKQWNMDVYQVDKNGKNGFDVAVDDEKRNDLRALVEKIQNPVSKRRRKL